MYICVVISVHESVHMGVMTKHVWVGVCMGTYQSILSGLKVLVQTS